MYSTNASEGPRFKPRSGDGLSWFRLIWVFSVTLASGSDRAAALLLLLMMMMTSFIIH